MIKIIPILKRSWHILWSYRILWLFGLLLALTAGTSTGNRNNINWNVQNSRVTTGSPAIMLPQNAPAWMHDLTDWANQAGMWLTQNVLPVVSDPLNHIGTILLVLGLAALFCLLVGTLFALVRYPSETAVMRMVDEYERSGQKLGFGKGWKLGWSRRAFNMWLIDLLLAVPVLVLVMLLVSAGLLALASLSATYQVTSVIGIVAAVGLAFISVLLIIGVGLVLSLLRNFFVRAAALDGLGVWESFRQGWELFKRNWKSAILMWLVMIGVAIVFGITITVAFFLFIPLYLVLFIPALLVAFLPALAAFGITSIFSAGLLPWLIGILVALPFFFLVLFSPLVLVNGWYRIYTSSAWTLTYREIKVLQNHIAPAAPAVTVQATNM